MKDENHTIGLALDTLNEAKPDTIAAMAHRLAPATFARLVRAKMPPAGDRLSPEEKTFWIKVGESLTPEEITTFRRVGTFMDKLQEF